MLATSTGGRRLRAGLPGWRVGDKTGTNDATVSNDVGIAWPPGGGKPVLIASYISGAEVDDAARHAAHAAVGRVVAGAFA